MRGSALPNYARAPRRHRTRRRADMPLVGGVRPPVAILMVLLLSVAGLTVYALGSIPSEQVPLAVRDAEQQIAADAAVSVRGSISAEASTLRRAAQAYTPPRTTAPATALKAVVAGRRLVRGAALVDPATGQLLAASGGTVPLAGIGVDDLAADTESTTVPPRLVTAVSGARILYFARLTVPERSQDANADQSQDQTHQQTRHWLVVVLEPLPAPAVHGGGRVAWLAGGDGTVLATATGGQAPSGTDRTLPRTAARAAGASGWRSDASGSLLGATATGTRTVAGWAAVDTSGLHLTVVTAQSVPLTAQSTDYLRIALLTGGALAAIAVVTWLLLVFAVQRPLLRLHLSAARLARGAVGRHPLASEDLSRPVPVPAYGEPRRTGRALEALRRQLLGTDTPEEILAPRGPGTRALVACCALLVTAWAAPMLFVVNQVDTPASVPASVVAGQQTRTQYAAYRVRQSLDQSYTDLVDVSVSLKGKSTAQQRQVLRKTLADHGQYRSLYLLDRAGAIVLRVGQTPLRTIVHVPDGSGITSVNTYGKIPAIAAYAHIPAATAKAPGVAIFGEIDVKVLDGRLPEPGLGSVWLTDSHDKVLAAGVGFRAFQPLSGPGLRRLADRTRAPGSAGTATGAVLTSSGVSRAMSVAAAAPLAQAGPAAGLGWRVVTSKPAASLRLPVFRAERMTMLAGLLGLAVGVACLSWVHIVVVRPLRALARLAERLAGGDRRTVLYPVNHDETGSVTRSLEQIRQALADQARSGTTLPAVTRTEASSPVTAEYTPAQ
ncbi:HAMP domain-containing protein [Streptomyces sp. DG2A-72]|uniref:HAMP domain-containing protein n=1 Tax=Streptomyces sp. DG2A-72 TaxID=3051386 RepID=UPI00265C51C6|nr:HAMP domain-containing protein [Streptomyces sp. DG2A-72]MDO0930352.1 HAMP domain-containing protein [Streptomyces sp. DG2A-72]